MESSVPNYLNHLMRFDYPMDFCKVYWLLFLCFM